jgi:hypothetical protein
MQFDAAFQLHRLALQCQQGKGISRDVGFRYRYAAAIHMTVLDVGAVGVLGPAGARGHDIAMLAERNGGPRRKALAQR